MTNEVPLWLPRAWRIRAVLLTLVIGLLTLLLYGRAGGGSPAILAGGVALIGVALAADWAWLRRNHHRVNEWGLSRGKDARKKPK